MGQFDSTKTRVTPVFDQLLERDIEGTSWLPRLLRLPTRIGGRTATATHGRVLDAKFGEEEVRLDPPLSLLRWLILHPTALKEPTSASESSPGTLAKRRALLRGDTQTQAEALAALERGQIRGWHIFEGRSQPDVFLATEHAVIVIEGKRTERGATTDTSWFAGRHQMLRHLDCAYERRGQRAVYGFFIVEGLDGVPTLWSSACDETVREDVLRTSLPHRSDDERREIADAFLGATTWQAVCAELGLAEPST